MKGRPQQFEFCFIISDLLSTTPRAYREIWTVLKLGYSVMVVSNLRLKHGVEQHFRLIEDLKEFDNFNHMELEWRRINTRTLILKLIRKYFYLLYTKIRITNKNFLLLANDYTSIWQIIKCRKIRAKVYVGHRPTTLPVITYLAKKHHGTTWFDIEDYHFGESKDEKLEQFLSDFIGGYQIDFYTDASHLIAQAYFEKLGTKRKSIEILNSPLVSKNTVETKMPEGVPVFFWFSQNISFSRGLELFFEALQKTQLSCIVNLAGRLDPRFDEYMKNLNLQKIRINYFGFIPEEALMEVAAKSDFGLALELPSKSKNSDLAISNKILAYCTWGNYILATKTKGQSHFMERLPGNGILIEDQVNSVCDFLEELTAEKCEKIRAGKAKRIENSLPYSWLKQEEKLSAFIIELLNKNQVEEHSYHLSTLASV